jgi:hypothetical protein
MTTPKGYFNLPGRKIAPNEIPSASARVPGDLTFLIGDVKRVDVDRQKMYVDFRRGYGSGIVLDISQPFSGTRSFVQATPEEGSIILVGHQTGEYFPIAYLPNYAFGLENRNVEVWPDDVKTQEKNEHFFRVRKLKEGWISLGSTDGIEVLLGDYFKIDDSCGNSFILRPEDNAIINTSLNNYVFSSGVWRNAGVVRRNSISPIELDDIPNAFKDVRINGKDTFVIRPQNSDGASDPYLVEYLLEVDDRDFGVKPINDVNFNLNKTIRKPVAIFSLGNFIGNNSNDGNYGRVLRPVLFTDPDDNSGNFSFEPVSGDGIDNFASAITLFKPNSTSPSLGAYFGIDKEGHFFQHIPAATGGGLGKGRSMSILARGSKKEVWGQDSRYANSWDLDTVGGIRWQIGSHNERDGNPYSNRSMDIRTSSSVFFMYGSELSVDLYDFDKKDKKLDSVRKYYKIEKIGGNERVEVESTRETIIQGSDKLAVKGARIEKVSGASTISIGSGYNIIVGDAFTEKVTKEKNESFGNRKTFINSGNSELVIKSIKGDIIEEITKVGNKKLKLMTGNIEEEITGVGNRKFTTNSGNFTASTKVGNITFTTSSGNMGFNTSTGKVTIGAKLNIGIETSKASTVNISGGSINLTGRLGNSGGVITNRTHLDYITGAPLKGSSTVKATM